MLKKFLFGLLTLALLTPSVILAKAYEPGFYKTKSDVNVRATPSATGERINNVPKNRSVYVQKAFGNWCKIQHLQKKTGYVYCPLLENIKAANIPKTTTTYRDVPMDYSSSKYRYAVTFPFRMNFYEEYSFITEPPSKGGFLMYVDIYLRPDRYDKHYAETEDFKKVRTETYVTKNNFELTLDYFNWKSSPDSVFVTARYEEFPIPGNIITLTYNKKSHPDGEQLFKKTLDSAKRQNGSDNKVLTTYFSPSEVAPFLIQYPSDWEMVENPSLDKMENVLMLFRNNKKDDDFTANISIVKTEVDQAASHLEYGKEVLAEEMKSIANFKKIKQEEIVIEKIGNYTTKGLMVWFEGKMNGSEETLSYIQTYAKDGVDGYIITGAYALDEEKAVQKTVEDTVRSFTLPSGSH